MAKPNGGGEQVRGYVQPSQNRRPLRAQEIELALRLDPLGHHAHSEIVLYLAAKMQRADGSPVPVGTTARFGQGEESFPVGHDGQVFLELTAPIVDLDVRWNAREHCTVLVADIPAVPDLAQNYSLPCRQTMTVFNVGAAGLESLRVRTHPRVAG